MLKMLRFTGKFAVCILVLLCVWQLGCKTELIEDPQEVPITTQSKEARDLFIEGRRLVEFNHSERAYKLFGQAVEKDPEFALGWLFKAQQSAETKDFQENLKRAVSLAPNASEGEQKLIAAFQARMAENNASKALGIYEELALLYPNDARLHWYLGDNYSNRDMTEEALASWEKALVIDDSFAPVYQSLGYLYRWEEDYAEAEESFQKYLSLAPNEPNAHDNLGDLYRKMGRLDDAIDHYKKAVEMDPSFETSAYKAATTLFFQGKYEEGRQGLQELMEVRIEPVTKVYDMEGICRSYIYEGDFAKAMELTDKVIEMAQELGLPENVSFAYIVKGAIHCELKDLDAAESALNDCLDFLEKSDLVAYYKNNQTAMVTFWKTLIAKDRGDFNGARSLAEDYKVQLEAVGNPSFMKYPSWMHAIIVLAEGDPAKADEMFVQADVDHPFFWHYHGLAKEQAGDMEGAKELYRKVANWNSDGIWYCFVRQKAIDKL